MTEPRAMPAEFSPLFVFEENQIKAWAVLDGHPVSVSDVDRGAVMHDAQKADLKHKLWEEGERLRAEGAAGPRVEVDGDASNGWIITIRDGEHTKAYSPFNEHLQAHASAPDAVADALRAFHEEFDPKPEAADAPSAVGLLHARVETAHAGVAQAHQKIDALTERVAALEAARLHATPEDAPNG